MRRPRVAPARPLAHNARSTGEMHDARWTLHQVMVLMLDLPSHSAIANFVGIATFSMHAPATPATPAARALHACCMLHACCILHAC